MEHRKFNISVYSVPALNPVLQYRCLYMLLYAHSDFIVHNFFFKVNEAYIYNLEPRTLHLVVGLTLI